MDDDFSIESDISERRANGATQWLFDNRNAIGKAKAERDKSEHMLRVTKNLIIAASELKTVSEREAEAYAHPHCLQPQRHTKPYAQPKRRRRLLLICGVPKTAH